MEYSSSGNFEDRATLAFVNRLQPVVPFTVSRTSGLLSIATSYVNISYLIGAPFSPSTLWAEPVSPSSDVGYFTPWSYGMLDTGNLFGTIRSLDDLGPVSLNCTENSWMSVHSESLHCEWGVVSSQGWTIVNDTSNQALTSQAEWWDGWNTDDEDLYLCVLPLHSFKK